MIAVLNREFYQDGTTDRLENSEFRVGNDTTTPTANPSCGLTVMDGGFYDCKLWGRYVTLRRFSTINTDYHMGEISVWGRKNICPRGTATMSSVYTDSNGSRSADHAQNPEPVI